LSLETSNDNLLMACILYNTSALNKTYNKRLFQQHSSF